MPAKTTGKRRPRKRSRELTIVVPRTPSSLGLLTMEEAANELRIGKTSVIRLIALGQLKAIRPIPGGKTVRIFRTDLQAFVEGLRKSDA